MQTFPTIEELQLRHLHVLWYWKINRRVSIASTPPKQEGFLCLTGAEADGCCSLRVLSHYKTRGLVTPPLLVTNCRPSHAPQHKSSLLFKWPTATVHNKFSIIALSFWNIS